MLLTGSDCKPVMLGSETIPGIDSGGKACISGMKLAAVTDGIDNGPSVVKRPLLNPKLSASNDCNETSEVF